MPLPDTSRALQDAYEALSANFRGIDVDIYELCKEKRASSPVMEGDFMKSLSVPTNAGAAQLPTYTLFNYKDIKKVLGDSKTYTSGFMQAGFGALFGGDGSQKVMIAMDGEEHKNARSLLQPVFMPANVNHWKGEMDRVIREDFLAHMVDDGKADIMDFGLHFPIKIIYQLIGFPNDYSDKFYDFAAMGLRIIAGLKDDPEEFASALKDSHAAAGDLLVLVEDLVRQRRKDGAKGGDIISQLINAEYEGHQMDDKEIAFFARGLVTAGGETTSRTFSSIMTLLLQRPEMLARVKADRSLIMRVIDEGIRYEPVATVKVRQAAKDVEIGGMHIPAGALVQGMVASANRDEAVIERPDDFDIDRKTPMSFTFGGGPHTCIGQFIAKLEIEAAMNAIFDMMPNVRIDPDYPAPEIRGGMLRGAGAVNVRWD